MKDKIVETLKNILSFKTFEGNKEEFDKAFDYIKDNMPSYLNYKEYTFNNKRAVVISNTEDKNLDLVFCTHIDVVPIDDFSFKYEDNKIIGRGTIDMKGGVAICLSLLFNNKFNKKIALFITTDEEIDGYCASQLLEIYNPSFAIIPDGGNNFKFVREEKGLLQLKVSTTTLGAHASQPYNSENAIVKLMNLYSEMIKKYPLPKSSEDYITSVNLSKIIGGNAVNKVPDYAEMYLDIRHISEDKKEDFINFIKDFDKTLKVGQICAGPLFKTDMNNKNINDFIKISEKVLNKKVEITATESTSDGIYFSEKNIPTAIMNPYGDYAHCKNEYVEINGLEQLYEIYKEFIEKM